MSFLVNLSGQDEMYLPLMTKRSCFSVSQTQFIYLFICIIIHEMRTSKRSNQIGTHSVTIQWQLPATHTTTTITKRKRKKEGGCGVQRLNTPLHVKHDIELQTNCTYSKQN